MISNHLPVPCLLVGMTLPRTSPSNRSRLRWLTGAGAFEGETVRGGKAGRAGRAVNVGLAVATVLDS